MALLSPAGQALALNAVAGAMTFTAMHSATPGTTGASEITSGTARQATAWTTATSGTPAVSNTGALSFPLPASTTVTHIAGWTALTVGTYEWGFTLGSSVSSGATAGTLTVAVGALSGSGS